MQNTLIVLVGPSGVGKTTIAKIAKKVGVATHLVRSVTDRPQGPKEDDSEYLFVKKGEFDPNDCVEYAEYAGNKYGILKAELDAAIATPRSMAVTEINGARQLKLYCEGKAKVILVFINSVDAELRERLERRGRGGVEERLARAAKDREPMTECDFIVQNKHGKLAYTIGELRRIYKEATL